MSAGTAMGIQQYLWSKEQLAPLGFVHTIPTRSAGDYKIVYVGFELWAQPATVAAGSSTKGILMMHGTNGNYGGVVPFGDHGTFPQIAMSTACGFIQTDLFTEYVATGTWYPSHPAFVEGDYLYGWLLYKGQGWMQVGQADVGNQRGVMPDYYGIQTSGTFGQVVEVPDIVPAAGAATQVPDDLGYSYADRSGSSSGGSYSGTGVYGFIRIEG